MNEPACPALRLKKQPGACSNKDHLNQWFKAMVPDFLAPRTSFMEDSFSADGRVGELVSRMIQVHYISCALHFYYFYQLHLRSSSFRCWRLGTLVFKERGTYMSEARS